MLHLELESECSSALCDSHYSICSRLYVIPIALYVRYNLWVTILILCRFKKLEGCIRLHTEKKQDERVRWKKRRFEKAQQEKPKALDVKHVVETFKEKVSEIPSYTCCVCARFRFRTQVQKYASTKYQDDYIRASVDTDTKQEWICIPCHQSLVKNKVPPLSVVGNKLKPLDMPADLAKLNTGTVPGHTCFAVHENHITPQRYSTGNAWACDLCCIKYFCHGQVFATHS